jgi:Ni,Fe-hydrogenase maturation factor
MDAPRPTNLSSLDNEFDEVKPMSDADIESLKAGLDERDSLIVDQIQQSAPGLLEEIDEKQLQAVAAGDMSLTDALSTHPALKNVSEATIERLIEEDELTNFLCLSHQMHPSKIQEMPDLDPEVRAAVDEMLEGFAEEMRRSNGTPSQGPDSPGYDLSRSR